MAKIITILLAMILFPYSFDLCEHFFYSEPNSWDDLRHCLYMLNLAILCFAFMFPFDAKYEKYVQILLCIFIWWILIPSLIGRACGDKQRDFWDIISIIIGFSQGFYKFKKNSLKI